MEQQPQQLRVPAPTGWATDTTLGPVEARTAEHNEEDKDVEEEPQMNLLNLFAGAPECAAAAGVDPSRELITNTAHQATVVEVDKAPEIGQQPADENISTAPSSNFHHLQGNLMPRIPTPLKVAVAQMPEGGVEPRLAVIRRLAAEGKASGAELVVFPE